MFVYFILCMVQPTLCQHDIVSAGGRRLRGPSAVLADDIMRLLFSTTSGNRRDDERKYYMNAYQRRMGCVSGGEITPE